MDASEVLRVLDALESVDVRTGITGGWGIDALLRRETRPHRDLDLGIASDAIDRAVQALESLGYLIAGDERPARIELVGSQGRVDLHPIAWRSSGAGTQAGFDGQTFEYPVESLDALGEIGGRPVRCGTPALQLAFHAAFEPRDHDRQDMAALAKAFGISLPPSYGDEAPTSPP